MEDDVSGGVLISKKSLTISEVIEFLENADNYHCIPAPPSKPKASLVFLYKTDDAAKEGIIIISIHTGVSVMYSSY